jgi:hypothetical protein
MGLVGSLWNRDIRLRLQHLNQHLARQAASGERPSKPTRPTFKRRRPGTILEAVTTVLVDQPEGMRVRDIVAAVAARLGGPVAKASIKSCLWLHAQGDKGRFEQLGQRRYRLRV